MTIIDTLFQKCDESCYKSINSIKTPKGMILIATGLGFGWYYYSLNTSLLGKIITKLGLPPTRPDPFGHMSVYSLALLTPIACLIGPIGEEVVFRGGVQETFNNKLEQFYKNRGFSDAMSRMASRITSIFFTTFIFAGVHLSNLIFAKDSSTVYAQTILAVSGGLTMGLAKEFSGELLLSVGIHIGNNVAALVTNFQCSSLKI